MKQVTIQPGGAIALPADICQRYGLTPNTAVRLVETPSGILVVPLTGAPMSAELRAELAEWQALGTASWERFSYEEDAV